MSDDEDLENLRLAALQTLKKKPVPEPFHGATAISAITTIDRSYVVSDTSQIPFLSVPPPVPVISSDIVVNTAIPPPFYPPPVVSQPPMLPPVFHQPPPSYPPWDERGANHQAAESHFHHSVIKEAVSRNRVQRRGVRNGRGYQDRRQDRLPWQHGRDGPRRGWRRRDAMPQRENITPQSEAQDGQSVIKTIRTVEETTGKPSEGHERTVVKTNVRVVQRKVVPKNNNSKLVISRKADSGKSKAEVKPKVKVRDKFERFRDSDDSDSSDEESMRASDEEKSDKEENGVKLGSENGEAAENGLENHSDLDNVSSHDELVEEIAEEEVEDQPADQRADQEIPADTSAIQTLVTSRPMGRRRLPEPAFLEVPPPLQREPTVFHHTPPQYLQQPFVDSTVGRVPSPGGIRSRLGRGSPHHHPRRSPSPFYRSPRHVSPPRRRHRTPSLSPSPPKDYGSQRFVERRSRSPPPMRVLPARSRSRSPIRPPSPRRFVSHYSPARRILSPSRRSPRSPRRYSPRERISTSPYRRSPVGRRRSLSPRRSPRRLSPHRRSVSPRRVHRSPVRRSRSRTPPRRVSRSPRKISPLRSRRTPSPVYKCGASPRPGSGGGRRVDVVQARRTPSPISEGFARKGEVSDEERKRMEARKRKFEEREVHLPAVTTKISLRAVKSELTPPPRSPSPKKKETTSEEESSEEEEKPKKKSKKRKEKDKKKKKKEKKQKKKKKRKSSSSESESEEDKEKTALKLLSDKKVKKALSAIESLAGFKIEIKPKVAVKATEEVTSSGDLRDRLKKKKDKQKHKVDAGESEGDSEKTPDISSSRKGSASPKVASPVKRTVEVKTEGITRADPLLLKMKEQNAKIEARKREIEEDIKKHA